MTDSPNGGPLSVPTPTKATQAAPDAPRTLSAYGEGHLLPPMTTEVDRVAFEVEQRLGWQARS